MILSAATILILSLSYFQLDFYNDFQSDYYVIVHMTELEYAQAVSRMFATIVGCAFKSYNYFHSMADELTYEAGLYCELSDAGFVVHRQEMFPIYYKGRPSPVNRRIDLVATDKALGNVLLELKAVNYVGDEHRRQLWSYMRLQNFRYGMLINFGPQGVYSENWKLDEMSGRLSRV